MSITTSAGIRFLIGPAHNTTYGEDDAGRAAALTALKALTYVEVGEVEDAGEIGDEASTSDFTALANRRKRKVKGTFDAGTQQITLGSDPTDAGQKAVKAAQRSDDNYAVQIDYGDGEADFYTGQVLTFRKQIGTAEAIRKTTVSIAINSAIYEQEASATA
ncbi:MULTISPECIES: phage tail tube protein [unclassified Pseudomonas]|uniref:phage tail tube protein n=1 Tax=unclassified Pseudomonas TaxID=196821 RepID=UPI0025D9B89C|nr:MULTISPECIES: phage tail tube protein [unclassified Pseudomonas]